MRVAFLLRVCVPFLFVSFSFSLHFHCSGARRDESRASSRITNNDDEQPPSRESAIASRRSSRDSRLIFSLRSKIAAPGEKLNFLNQKTGDASAWQLALDPTRGAPLESRFFSLAEAAAAQPIERRAPSAERELAFVVPCRSRSSTFYWHFASSPECCCYLALARFQKSYNNERRAGAELPTGKGLDANERLAFPDRTQLAGGLARHTIGFSPLATRNKRLDAAVGEQAAEQSGL